MSVTRVSVSQTRRRGLLSLGPSRCRRKFLRYFADGFEDEQYVAWERGYKWNAHRAWQEVLHPRRYRTLLQAAQYSEIANQVVRIESRTNLLFSFEKMALRDAVKSANGAKMFASGLYNFLHGKSKLEARFTEWIDTVAQLPRKQTRVLTWPIVTVFGYIACPDEQIFLKPKVTQRAAREYDFDFHYQSRPNWETYRSLLQLAGLVRRDLMDLRPRDMIDIQSFLWVQGSDEYPD